MYLTYIGKEITLIDNHDNISLHPYFHSLFKKRQRHLIGYVPYLGSKYSVLMTFVGVQTPVTSDINVHD